MTDNPLVLPFQDDRCRTVNLAGGKGASLASMTAQRPAGTPGIRGHLRCVHSRRSTAKRSCATSRTRTWTPPVRWLPRTEPPRDLIKALYDEFPAGTSVAVRSSACAEDGDDASYAGQQETYLFVESFDEVMTRIVDCWLSFFSERALWYRLHKGSLDDINMAVVVQQMVDATKAGVMFTVDPVTGRRDRLVVEAALGVGEHVVSGEVTPDYYALDRRARSRRPASSTSRS